MLYLFVLKSHITEYFQRFLFFKDILFLSNIEQICYNVIDSKLNWTAQVLIKMTDIDFS